MLSDFAPVATYVNDIFPLPDGRVLVAVKSTVTLHDPNGALVRTVVDVTSHGFGADFDAQQIAVTPDGQSLWIAAMDSCGSDRTRLKVSMADGHEIARHAVTSGINWADGLVAGNANIAGVPTANDFALLALTISLALFALFLLRR